MIDILLEAIPLIDKFNMSLIKENDSLLLAISGGIDSMVMLHCVNEVKTELNLKIAVAHFDHQKRKESFLDRQLVEDTCKKLSIECFTEKLSIDSNENFHDFARKERYDFFVKKAININANKILLAHNLNDNAETVMMRLTRGSSFEGYRGILEVSKYKNIQIIRPILNISRDEIETYQEENSIKYNEDNSNLEDHYTRNRYRHHVLPLLAQENPKYLEKIKQFSEYQELAYDLIAKLANKFIKKDVIKQDNEIIIDINKFNKLDEIIKIEVIKNLVNIHSNNSIELTYINIKDIRGIFLNNKPHLELYLDNNLYIYKSYDKVFLKTQKSETQDYEFTVKEFGEYPLPNGHLVIITKNPANYYGNMFKLCYNNLDFIFPLIIRNRRNGDRIKTSSGTKKIKDVFINKKVPLVQRNELPIILNKDNKEIIWIPYTHKTKSTGKETLYLIYQGDKSNA